MAARFFFYFSMLFMLLECAVSVTFSARLIHRFSEEVKALRKNSRSNGRWPERRSLEYYRMLANSDFQRQHMKLGPHHQLLFPSEGSETMSFGNDFGWLHYTWIDIGTPNASFLVALDSGSDLLWVPCECVQCAPLSSSNYDNLDRDLNEYKPSGSNTSRHLPCSHQLCEQGPNCKSPKYPCPYTVNYYSEDTSSSGLLVEDILHLASGSADASSNPVRAPVLIGCGSKQSGGYLDGVAPDGLMGLGLGDISVPSFLSKQGLVRNSFSLCFNEDNSGRIFFGDQGSAAQQTAPFLPSNGKYVTYIVGVEACCVGSSCPEQTSFKALVDSGTSFTFLPHAVYQKVVEEFDGQVNATKSSFEGYPWQYCYESSSEVLPKLPSLTLKFALNNSFVVHTPIFVINDNQGVVVGFCLALQPADGDMGVIGQNFMAGYRIVFDRENLKLGWSSSHCQDVSDGENMPLTPPPNSSTPTPLPATEQQSAPHGHAIAPAIAGRTPSKSAGASVCQILTQSSLAMLLLVLLLLLHPIFGTF